jgi:hypothetical protein
VWLECTIDRANCLRPSQPEHVARILLAVPNPSGVDDYLADCNRGIRELAGAASGILIEQGCTAYVKTIYIGFESAGEMVAALYAHGENIEVALALPEDCEGALLVDASHLTWRTLPVAAVIRKASELEEFRELALVASERVRMGEHDVERDTEFFAKARRERYRST